MLSEWPHNTLPFNKILRFNIFIFCYLRRHFFCTDTFNLVQQSILLKRLAIDLWFTWRHIRSMLECSRKPCCLPLTNTLNPDRLTSFLSGMRSHSRSTDTVPVEEKKTFCLYLKACWIQSSVSRCFAHGEDLCARKRECLTFESMIK